MTQNKKGTELYEEWMDYKGTRTRTNSLASSKTNGARYSFANDYAQSVSTTPIATPKPLPPKPRKSKTPVPVISTKSNSDEELLRNIKNDFGPFYAWVINGRKDDIKEEVIKGLLFK